MDIKKIIPTDEEIEKAFENTNFGPAPNWHTLKYSLLKVASGYHTGHTSQCILIELGLVTPKLKTLTKRGKYCLWEWFEKGYKDY